MRKLGLFLLACLFFATLPAISAPPPPHPWDPHKPLSVQGNWTGTGKILAPLLDLEDINVVLKITKQSGSRFYGTMDISLTYGETGASLKCFRNVLIGDNKSYTCAIAGNINAIGELSISGANTFGYIDSVPWPATGPPEDFVFMVASLKQEVTASLIKGKSPKIEGNFRATVNSFAFHPGALEVGPQSNPYNFQGAAFSGTFILHKVLEQ